MEKTHGGNIGSEESGYVWLSCSHYNLPDNTAGGTGYHVVYRPLCGSMYKGNELVTDEMIADIRSHYAEVRTRKEAAEEAAVAAMLARITGQAAQPSLMDKMLCKCCGTVCYGDCEA